MCVEHRTIPRGHPNRPGFKLTATLAHAFHFTDNDRPWADDKAVFEYFARPYVFRQNKNWASQFFESDGVTPFRFGAAQRGIDMDSMSLYMLDDDKTWHCGDVAWQHVGDPMWEQIPQNNGYDGYKPVAGHFFRTQWGILPNDFCLGWEMCNNDAIPNSLDDWDKTVYRTIMAVREWNRVNGRFVDPAHCLSPHTVFKLEKNEILLLRHYDITGKICPKPMVDDYRAWERFVLAIAE